MSTLKVINLQHPSNANNNVVLDANGNMTCTGTVVGSSPTGGMRNRLINGGFDIWQRATSFSNWSSFSYLVDRWRIGYDTTAPTGTSFSQGTFAPGQTVVPGDPKYYAIYSFPNCGTPSNYIRSDTESVRTFAGRTCTFSFWAAVPSGTMTVTVWIAQEFGTGGSPSAGVYGYSPQTFTITTTWQKFVYTVTMPSISGKTLGTNGDDRIWPAIYMPTNAAGTIWLANMQLEEGSVATAFEKRPIGLELQLCKRYYQKYAQPMLRGVFSGGASADRMGMMLPVEMRATPTASISGTSMRVYDGGSTTNITSIRTTWATPRHIEFDLNTGAAMTAGRAGVLYSDGNDYMALDSEL